MENTYLYLPIDYTIRRNNSLGVRRSAFRSDTYTLPHGKALHFVGRPFFYERPLLQA